MDPSAADGPVDPREATGATHGSALDVVAGGGLGLLLGLIVGLATSPVVGIVVGALTSLLAVFLGLDGGSANAPALSRVRLNGLRIGSFGFAAAIGVLAGLYVRINNPLVESPSRHLARWQAALPGDPALAQKMMIFERTNLTLAMLNADKDSATGAKLAEGTGAHRAGLFAGEQDASACRDLEPDVRFGGDVAKLLEAFGKRPEPYPTVARKVAKMPPDQQGNALRAVHAFVCGAEQAAAQEPR